MSTVPDPRVPVPTVVFGPDAEERLRRLQAITDVELSRLELEDLLPELLERVRELLGTDTAAVLLMDESETFLVASAARGLEEEVRQGSRVPLGRGFAGTIAATRSPVILDEVTPTSVVNPVLLYKGVRSMLGVPLLDGDRVLGVMHVGSLRTRRFTGEDVKLLEQVADRAALALGTVRARTDKSAALALQRGLGPHRLPRIPGLELAARYVPDSVAGVGGDWYDVFTLPGGMVGVAMGDVMGHGLQAATVMGRLRSALRAYALEDEDPASVLDRLDREIQHFEPGQMATAMYAVVDPGSGKVALASAGHLPAAVARPGSPVELLESANDMMLGVVAGVHRSGVRLTLPEGGLLCLFTDGLVERREEELGQGLRELREALAPEASAEAVCATVMAELMGEENVDDDVALLVVKRPAAPDAG